MIRRLVVAGLMLAATPVATAAAAGLPGAAAARPGSLYAEQVERARASVEAAMRAGIDVPVPKDPGGGASHEQHKRNWRALYDAGALYRITGERRYADFVRDLLLAYAKLYPGLGTHPAGRGELPGRLFWQTLNDSNWLFWSVQGYGAVKGALSPAERQTIETRVFRPMARFLSDETPANFNRIHNHATWATAAVGLTGYVLGDPVLVDKALLGLDRSGKTGFLKQLDLLFSPDGYYEEGPYYQRYALLPFIVFANAVDTNEPARRIFEHRDGVLLKAVRTTIQLSYGGLFLPLNDAIKDKGLATEELYHAVAIAYAKTRDPAFLSIAAAQGRTVLTPEGAGVAQAVAAGLAQPFPFATLSLRDGPGGDRGALAILRMGEGEGHQALVAKNTSQGMGHGHFDKLNWLLYDNGREVVTDYGAARFLNIEAKRGGVYLPENTSWAKQTVAHNTLVVDETSHFGGDLERAQALAPQQLLFADTPDTKIVSARMTGAYDGVTFTRTLALVRHPDLAHPVAVDLLKVRGAKPARYDLPIHYQGHLVDIGLPLRHHVAERPVLGAANGYQHLWVDAEGRVPEGGARLTWLLGNRFYSYRVAPPPGAELLLAESGASDPEFNLRREPAIIQRASGMNATFASVLEPHGEYNGAAEYTIGASSQIASLARFAGPAGDVLVLRLASGARLTLAVAADPKAPGEHAVEAGGRTIRWQGAYARIDDRP